VRFTCGNCGRVYVADDRIEGRAFRMRCKRCGHTISVGCAPSPAPKPAQAGDGSDRAPDLTLATPEKGGPAGVGEVGQEPEPRPAANPAPVAERPSAAESAAADGIPPAAGKGKLALLVVIGVVTLAAAGGVAWYLEAFASRSLPQQAERPREAASAATRAANVPPEASPAPGSAPASAASLPVEAPARPAEPAVAARASTPEALPVPPSAGATWKAERRERKLPAPSPVAPSAPPRSAAAPASPDRPGPGSAAIPAAPPRADLPPLDEQQIQATLAKYATSFDGCVAEARRDEPDLLASPRPVVVTLTVRPSGKALYPTLDDAQLSGTALGACVKKQSARMVFPESGGEPVPVRMPLLLGR